MVGKRRVEEPAFFPPAAIRPREARHFKGEGQWVAVAQAPVIHRGVGFGVGVPAVLCQWRSFAGGQSHDEVLPGGKDNRRQ
jgi:hypothetical protein